MKASIISAVALPMLASAAIHTVQVAQGGYTFTPSSVTAAVGDQIAFVFDGNGHYVAQGAFGNACQPASKNPFYSGPANSGQTYTITVKNTLPTPFYCVPHCRLGMAGVINPKGAKTAAKYIAAAKAASGSTAPSKIQGGTLSG